MQQLTGLDASWVYTESARTPQHVTGLYVYDPSKVKKGVSFDDIVATFSARLNRTPTFRRKLVRVPLDIDHPYWTQADDFDIEFHLRQVALPSPGDWNQLCLQVGRLHARQMDLRRPPWEVTVVEGLDAVEGLPPGCFAIVWKTHHSAIDGVSGVEIVNAVHDNEPHPTASPDDDIDASSPEPVPSVVSITARGATRMLLNPFNAARSMARVVPSLAPFVGQLRRGDLPPMRVPPTRFGTEIGTRRVFDGRRVALTEIKRWRHAVEGATVNDAMLTIVGGTLMRYLGDKDELPDASLTAMIPVSTRTTEQMGTAGNQITAVPASLFTTVDDPLERLAAVSEGSRQSKQLAKGVGAQALSQMSEFTPGLLIGLGSRALPRIANRMPFNTAVTNVPGSPVPLYLSGAEMVQQWGMGPNLHGMALMHAICSYRGTMMIAFNGCGDALPDPRVYADCLQESIDEISAAVT